MLVLAALAASVSWHPRQGKHDRNAAGSFVGDAVFRDCWKGRAQSRPQSRPRQGRPPKNLGLQRLMTPTTPDTVSPDDVS